MENQLEKIKSVYPLMKSDFLIGYEAFIKNEIAMLRDAVEPISIAPFFIKFYEERERLENVLFKIYNIPDVCLSKDSNFSFSVKEYLRMDIVNELKNLIDMLLICIDCHNEQFNLKFNSKIFQN